MLPFSRETPDRLWLGFVDEEESRSASVLTTRLLPLLAVAGLAALVLSGGKRGADPEAPPPPSSAAAARMHLATAGGQGDPDPKTAPEPSRTQPAPEPRTEPVAAAAPPEPDPPSPPKPARTKLERTPKPLSATATRRAARAARSLRGALADGSVRASRESFAWADDTDEVGWEDAKFACSNLQVVGVGGWSLPTRSEARELHRGQASPGSAYWTRQRGLHGDTVYVYDPRTRRSSPWLEQEIASVVCIQPRPR